MAKTIEEMSRVTLCGLDVNDNQTLLIRSAFIQGANAVLEEIEPLLHLSQIHSYHEIYDDIMAKIKELKGE